MAYLNAVNLHALPVNNQSRSPEPASVVFCHGPEWTWRYQRNQKQDRLDNRFMYQDQGPPMYRMLGPHFTVHSLPPKTDFHTQTQSFHFEPSADVYPSYKNGNAIFPPGAPPAQTAMFDGLRSSPGRDIRTATTDMANQRGDSYLAWDKYRYLPGPPSETQIYRQL